MDRWMIAGISQNTDCLVALLPPSFSANLPFFSTSLNVYLVSHTLTCMQLNKRNTVQILYILLVEHICTDYKLQNSLKCSGAFSDCDQMFTSISVVCSSLHLSQPPSFSFSRPNKVPMLRERNVQDLPQLVDDSRRHNIPREKNANICYLFVCLCAGGLPQATFGDKFHTSSQLIGDKSSVPNREKADFRVSG